MTKRSGAALTECSIAPKAPLGGEAISVLSFRLQAQASKYFAELWQGHATKFNLAFGDGILCSEHVLFAHVCAEITWESRFARGVGCRAQEHRYRSHSTHRHPLLPTEMRPDAV
eukprot:CAMPEP_0179086270 /NCGR_PEP_ID=MMETSP0796-20121207/39122_1 /TAXON_ID=73915 /ORGANISM="Pyrodinium bahamense, Strain pbaha01" /LENGTH=113 /DNA_ID=CAMNT_0020783733 /DNA_START=209 /DNA_END=546 /DNA_ORIENTATION=-